MKNAFCFSLLFTLCALSAQAQIDCVIRGEVIDRPESRQLLLLREGEDLRLKAVSIPIEEGRFEYTLSAPHEEVYRLVFEDEYRQGSWRPILFFAENDTVRLTLYPMDRADGNAVDGGAVNRLYAAYLTRGQELFDPEPLYREMDTLDESGRAYNRDFLDLNEIIENTEDKAAKEKALKELYKMQDEERHYSPEGEAVNQKIKRFHQQIREWEIGYARENVSIAGYFILVQKLRSGYHRMGLDHTSAYELYNTVYANAYPDHPYTDEVRTIILSQSHIKPGGKYLDFTAPDFEGRPVKLSEQIDGKIALIDLWASWCGPCRRTSKSMIPVYEKFRDRGFTIVGVAREAKAENGVAAARQDGYPWLNLLDVKDAAGIWNLYGVGNAGGATFLVDRDGTILAVSPEAAEVEQILNEKIK